MKYQLDSLGIPKLNLALSDYMKAEDVRKLAALTGQKLPTGKGDLAAVVIRHLAGERLLTVWQSLDELQQAAVAEVVHSESTQFPAERFRAKYGRDPDWGSDSQYPRDRRPSALCFFFYRSVMPDDLKERLRAFVPPPVEANVKVLDQLPAAYDRPFERWNPQQRTRDKGIEKVTLALHERERPAQREALSVLRLVDAGKVAVSATTRRPSAATIDVIAAILEGGDYYPRVAPKRHDENAGPVRAFAWPLLMQAGGLAQISGTRLQLTKTGRKALFEPPAGTIRALWRKWLDTRIFDELSRIECVKGQNGRGKHGLTAVSSRRSAVALALARCPAGGWVSTAEFLRFRLASGSRFSVTRDPWDLYIGELQYGSLGYEGGSRILEERYILGLLLEYAATLGLIDVALIPPAGARRDFRSLWGTDELPFFSRYDGLMYFRLTPLGAYCLGVESGYQAEPPEAKQVLRVLPNLEIAAIGPDLEQGDRLALDACATRVSDHVWRLDEGQLLVAISEGRTVEEIREFLTSRSSVPIPGVVARLLDDIAERSVKVRDCGLARLIECADAALAALIANHARTRKHCMRAGERHLAVPGSSEAAFLRSLREIGYLLSAGAPLPGKESRTRKALHRQRAKT